MKLQKHHDYQATLPDGTTRRVTFLGWAGAGRCNVVNHGKGPAYMTLPRFRIAETPKKAI